MPKALIKRALLPNSYRSTEEANYLGEITMNLKERWLEELRSGNRKQNKNSLRSGDSFCCLGVLCDVYDKDAWKHEVYDGCPGLPPSYVVEDFTCQGYGVSDSFAIPIVDTKDSLISLVSLNDSGMPFSQIADVIEYFFDFKEGNPI